MASSASCTLKCVPEPDHLGDHPAVVLTAYACAFLPLAVIYALDFITEEWKTIKATRRTGLIHLFVSLPPLAFVIVYIHLQKLMGDYKEMSAGITVAVFCMVHVFRTVWGLVQLREFKRWSMHALYCLRRVGYTSGPDDDDDLEETVDTQMNVNSSLLDNEFQNAALPAKWDHKSFFLQFCKEPFKALSLSNHMRCTLPMECSIHWMVAFLSQFGAKWLMAPKNISKNEDGGDVKRGREDLTKLRLLSALHVTHPTWESRRDQASIFPLDHLFFSDPIESQNAKLKIGPKCALPYAMRGAPTDTDIIEFEAYESTILDASTSWDKKSLNKLTQEERIAVRAITPFQLARFSKLIEQAAWNIPSSDLRFLRRLEGEKLEKGDPRVDTFLEQLGYGPDADLSNFMEALPDRSECIGRYLWDNSYRNDLLLQASVHVDNWISLEAGADMKRLKTKLEQRNISLHEEASVSELNQQHEIEMRKLQYKASEHLRASALSLETARFLGCVTESVRNFLSMWINDKEIDPSGAIWKPQGLMDTVNLVCSRQLTATLHAHKQNTERETSGLERSLFMRLLWELQSELHIEVSMKLNECHLADHRFSFSSSVPLIMLCILGYPSISIETTEDELRFEESPYDTVNIRAHQYDTDDEVLRRYKIVPVEGPQKLHVLVEIRSNGFSELQLHADAGTTPELYFDWQLWKDAFMGRLSAQSDWRASRLRSDSEMLRREASHSNVTDAFVRKGEEETGVGYGLTVWSGWPPHLSQISHFELTVSPKLLEAEYEEVPYANRKSATRKLEEALNAHFVDHQTATLSLSAQGRGPVPDEAGPREGTECRNSAIVLADADGIEELSTQEMNDAMRRNEALLAVHGLEATPVAHLYLGLCNLRTFDLAGTAFHQLLAANHLESFALRIHWPPAALTMGFLFERGSFLSRSDERLQPLLDELNTVERHEYIWGEVKPLEKQTDYEHLKILIERYMIEDSSTQQRTTRALKCRKTAVSIYGNILKSNVFSSKIMWITSNRLAILQLRYAIRAHIETPEHWLGIYRAALDCMTFLKETQGNLDAAINWLEKARAVENIDALCNMAVLKETQGNRDAAIDLLKHERLKSHSTALNNLAVMYEFETRYSVDSDEVKYLYEKAIEEDQNPVAKFNLAMLLKYEEDGSRGKDFLQGLNSQRHELSHMEVLLREIDKAAAASGHEVYAPLRKELEEIGDSLAFVKAR